MTLDKLKNILFYFFLISAAILPLIPFVFFSVYELDYAMQLSFNHNLLIVIFAVIFYFLIKNKLFKTKFRNKLIKPFMEIFFLIFGTFFIWMGCISIIAGFALVYNSIIGKQDTIVIKSRVLKVEETKSKNGAKHHYVTIFVPQVNRETELKVKGQYKINDVYADTLKLGSLKMVYKSK